MNEPSIPSGWENVKRPTTPERAWAILDKVLLKLREMDGAQFESAFRDFVNWFEPATKLINSGDLPATMRVAAQGRPAAEAIVEARFPRPGNPKANGKHPPKQAKGAPPPKKHRIARDAMQDLGYSANDLGNFEEPEELVKRLLPKFGVTMIGGQSGAGKTFFAINLALALAMGGTFFGEPIREQCGTLFIAAEGAGTIQIRLKAARQAAGIADDVELPIGTIRRCPDLKNPKTLELFLADLRMIIDTMEAQYGIGVGMLVIDTVASAFTMKDENDNAEVSAVCKILNTISERLQLAVVPIHHFGKNQEAGFRGASAWRGGVDHGLAILAERDGGTGRVSERSLSLAKSRMGEEGPVSGFTLETVELGTDRYGDPIISCHVKPEALHALHERKKTPVLGVHDKRFKAAFDDVKIGNPIRRRVRGNGPEVDALRVAEVRAEFERRFVSGDVGVKSTRRGAWRRAMDRALDELGYSGETDDMGIEWIWRPADELVPRET